VAKNKCKHAYIPIEEEWGGRGRHLHQQRIPQWLIVIVTNGAAKCWRLVGCNQMVLNWCIMLHLSSHGIACIHVQVIFAYESLLNSPTNLYISYHSTKLLCPSFDFDPHQRLIYKEKLSLCPKETKHHSFIS